MSWPQLTMAAVRRASPFAGRRAGSRVRPAPRRNPVASRPAAPPRPARCARGNRGPGSRPSTACTKIARCTAGGHRAGVERRDPVARQRAVQHGQEMGARDGGPRAKATALRRCWTIRAAVTPGSPGDGRASRRPKDGGDSNGVGGLRAARATASMTSQPTCSRLRRFGRPAKGSSAKAATRPRGTRRAIGRRGSRVHPAEQLQLLLAPRRERVVEVQQDGRHLVVGELRQRREPPAEDVDAAKPRAASAWPTSCWQ